MTGLATAAEAARELGVSRFYLYKLSPRETPGVYRFGRAKRFSVEELKAWARQHSNTEASNGVTDASPGSGGSGRGPEK